MNENEKFSFKIECDDSSNQNMYQNYASQIIPPPQMKKKKGTQIAALVLGFSILSATIGGGAGYLAATLNGEPSTVQTVETQSPNVNLNERNGTEKDENTNSILSAIAKHNENDMLTATEIFERCNSSVVAIRTELSVTNVFGQSSNQAAAGSGFIISADGYIVTNHHVIADASKIVVMLHDGTEKEAELIGSDAENDLAVLKINVKNHDFLSFGDSTLMKVGDMVAAIGNPLGELANSQTTGTVSATVREVNIEGYPMTMLQTDAAISPGNSGGPLINAYGEVIGIVSAKSVDTGVEGIGFAIPVEIAKNIIDELIEHGYVTGRPFIGIANMTTITSQMSKYYSIPIGVHIGSVMENTAADKAGLAADDVITKINGISVTSIQDILKIKRDYKAGDEVTITYTRDGKEYTCKLTFDEQKPTTEEVAPPAQEFNPRNQNPNTDDGDGM